MLVLLHFVQMIQNYVIAELAAEVEQIVAAVGKKIVVVEIDLKIVVELVEKRTVLVVDQTGPGVVKSHSEVELVVVRTVSAAEEPVV